MVLCRDGRYQQNGYTQETEGVDTCIALFEAWASAASTSHSASMHDKLSPEHTPGRGSSTLRLSVIRNKVMNSVPSISRLLSDAPFRHLNRRMLSGQLRLGVKRDA